MCVCVGKGEGCFFREKHHRKVDPPMPNAAWPPNLVRHVKRGAEDAAKSEVGDPERVAPEPAEVGNIGLQSANYRRRQHLTKHTHPSAQQQKRVISACIKA